MKVAVCYSGQLGPFKDTLPLQKNRFLRPTWDLFLYTSQLISQKVNQKPNYKPTSKVFDYCPANKGWRKNQSSYGVIYEISKDDIKSCLLPIKNQIKDSFIENESITESLKDWDMTKWQWLRLRQLRKMYNCNQIRKKFEKQNNIKYDIVVRSRFDIVTNSLDVENIYKTTKNADKKVFLFGGWPCVPPMVFMDEFICDGFAFGSPRVMDIFSSLYLQEQPYRFKPEYKETWDKFGDNVEYQLRTHLENNNIQIHYVGDKRTEYHLWR